jgi:hypothetical protein
MGEFNWIGLALEAKKGSLLRPLAFVAARISCLLAVTQAGIRIQKLRNNPQIEPSLSNICPIWR